MFVRTLARAPGPGPHGQLQSTGSPSLAPFPAPLGADLVLELGRRTAPWSRHGPA